MRKYLAAMLVTGMLSCTNTEQKRTDDTDTVISVTDTVVANQVVFKDPKIQAIFKGYISLKDALVNTKTETARQAAAALKIELAGYKGCEPTALIAEKIFVAKDIQIQREAFTALSQDVIALFKHAELNEGSIFVQHCPMANNGEGGDWLAAEKKIQNPYYGAEMMECGRVVEEIKSGK